jgi:hypothetical protein
MFEDFLENIEDANTSTGSLLNVALIETKSQVISDLNDALALAITAASAAPNPNAAFGSPLSLKAGAKAKRKTYKKKNIHIKKQTHPINAKKIKRKTTIKHKKVNKKKHTKENR